MKIGVSVIILCYNSDYNQIVMSIESVLQQSYSNYEIIIADDGTVVSCMPQIERYLEAKKTPVYLVLTRKVNGGTVRNCISALEKARGTWVQLLGAGDMLYDKDVLQDTVHFMDSSSCLFAFGKIQRFHMENHGFIDDGIMKTPRFPGFYQDHANIIQKLIQKLIIVLRYEAIPALAMFGVRGAFLEEIRKLEGRVIYCEDLFQVSVYLQGQRFYYLDKTIKRYELGVGISSSNNARFNRLLEKDVRNMYMLYKELYSYSAVNRVLLYACVKSPYLKKVMESFLDFMYKHNQD